jgi:hypothetical protein
MFVLSAGAYEEKNNCDVLLVSLPIRKETIVLSKYASVYVFAAFGLLLNLVLSLLGELVPGGKYGFPITADILFVLFVLLTLTFSISFPLMFKLGYAKSRVANFFLYFAFIFGVNVLADRFTADPAALQFFAERPDWEWMALLIVPTIVLLIVSYFLSLRFYKNREF